MSRKISEKIINRLMVAVYLGGTALRAAPGMGDYVGSAPVIPHPRRMRSIRTPENKLLLL